MNRIADSFAPKVCRRRYLGLLCALVVSACSALFPKPPGTGDVVPWSRLPGWSEDRHADAWPALLNSCARLAGSDAAWKALCEEAQWGYTPDDASARAFFERHFRAHEVIGNDGRQDGLITGYYEPLLYGSRTRDERYRYPLYKKPDNLLIIDLASVYPELRGRPVRGRLQGDRVVPYFSRAEIDAATRPLAGNELLWVDDAVALFMLQIQGSGRVQLPDGDELAVGYADQNGHPYKAIGRTLVERGALPADAVSLFSIRAWLKDNPQEAEAVLHSNPSYVFFMLRDTPGAGPLGSLNVPLTPERSIAVDPSFIKLGLPVWLDTRLPDDGSVYRRLMVAQDTGGAIKGAVRADVFFGRGDRAERLAGYMKQPGRLYVLMPRAPSGESMARH